MKVQLIFFHRMLIDHWNTREKEENQGKEKEKMIKELRVRKMELEDVNESLILNRINQVQI